MGWFQSAPAIAGGRCASNALFLKADGMFQSAPAIAGGRCLWVQGFPEPGVVSIRARHCWRAMRIEQDAAGNRKMFQSAPAIAGGRCITAVLPMTLLGVFQSAPAIAGGRCLLSLARPSASRCFNPRPPLLAGDATDQMIVITQLLSFNPRPPLLAGDALPRCCYRLVGRVSIRARHCWRAMRFQPKALKRLTFFTLSREQGAMN